MMITALLESWTINDQNYPEMSVGQTVNLAFGLAPESLETKDDSAHRWQHVCDAQYTFAGTVIRRYDEPEVLVVIHAGEMKFFIEGPLVQQCVEGDLVHGRGELFVDYYIWVEDLAERLTPPDISYNLVIDGIQRIEKEPGPDATKLTRIELRRTDAFSHSHSSYLMVFSVTDTIVPPTFLGA